MIYITGDTHGYHDFAKMLSNNLCELTRDDYVIIAEDCGVLFHDNDTVTLNLYKLLPYTVLFVDGNHENFDLLFSYPVEKWHGGTVHRIADNIIHLMRGQIYEIEGHSFFTFGGAFSYDKERRIEGISWWRQEMPSIEEYNEAVINLTKEGNKVDFIITHDCPSAFYHSVGKSAKILSEGFRPQTINTMLDDIIRTYTKISEDVV